MSQLAGWVLHYLTRPVVVAVAGSATVFVLLAAFVRGRDGGLVWDAPLADFLNALAPVPSDDVHIDPFLTGMALAVGALTAGLLAALLVRRRARAALFLVASIGGAVLLSRMTKGLVERSPIEGPTEAYSFPSGSATWSMATVAAVVLLARSARHRGLLIVAGAVLILGYGGVIAYEQWHYPSDVIAGWCLALAWVGALWLVLDRPRLPERRPRRGGRSLGRLVPSNRPSL